MANKPGYTLTANSAKHLARAVRHTARESREHYNVTPTAHVGRGRDTESVVWPAYCTGLAPGGASDLSGEWGLCEGKFLLPDGTAAVGANPWQEISCWLRPVPDHPYQVGDYGLAKLVGFRPEADGHDAMPVYVFLAGGSNGIDCGDKAWWTGLDTTDCLKLTVVSGITEQTLRMVWDVDSWTSDPETLTVPTNSGVVEFWVDAGRPHLSINGEELGEECSGDGFTIFSGGPATGHDDGSTTTCELRRFRVKVECCCYPAGYTTPGWYATLPPGGNCEEDELTIVALDDDTACNLDAVICCGPHASEEAAEAACLPVTAPCQSKTFTSGNTTATFSMKTGDCTCLPDTATESAHGVDTVQITTASCPGNIALTLACSGGFYELTTGTPGIVIELVSFSTGPLTLVYDISGYGSSCGGAGGTARLTIVST